MRHTWLLVLGLVLLGVGVLGLLVAEYFATTTTTTQSQARASSYATAGQRIFQTGLDAQGNPIPRSAPPVSEGALMMGGGGCASCHGSNGHGSTVSMMMGFIEAPDITYTTLTHEGYTDSTIERAIRDGVDEENKPLDQAMPRWHMTAAQLRDTLAYLKELSGQ
jgi:cytochrome c oxidase subunit 2